MSLTAEEEGDIYLKKQNIGMIFLLCLFFSCCGYRFTGSGNFPTGIRSIFVAILENRTSETGVENIFTNDLIYEFTSNSKVVLMSRDISSPGYWNG